MSSGPDRDRPTVAVIGAGVAGLTAAYLLAPTRAVTLYEAEDRLGGHAHTHDIVDGGGAVLPIDTGFIVHNDTTYPHLVRLFDEIGVRTRPTEMSMSIRDDRTTTEFAGGRGVAGVFAQPGRILDRGFWSVLRQVKRFHALAHRFLSSSDDRDQSTYGEFLHRHGFSDAFVNLYGVPLVSCVWSMGTDAALDYPARYLFRFLDNHGMLRLSGSPQWYTVVGGSRTYVDAIVARLPDVRSGRAVRNVLRDGAGAVVQDSSGERLEYDSVVIATHADQALGLLADASRQEKEILGAFRYSRSEVVLHTDSRLLPTAQRARASWNYTIPSGADGDHAPIVTYWMNRLQGLDSSEQHLVTLNATERIDPTKVIAVMSYEHPIYDVRSVAAQSGLGSLSTPRTAFAGAYHGWGFHEDGCRSGVAAARVLGVDW